MWITCKSCKWVFPDSLRDDKKPGLCPECAWGKKFTLEEIMTKMRAVKHEWDKQLKPPVQGCMEDPNRED